MKIAVDPGHGMSNRSHNRFDPGATHLEGTTTFREADIVLRYGLSLKDVIRARGHEVFMTRDDHEDHAPVGERAGNAERAACDVFISLHLNDFDTDTANGLEVHFRDDVDEALAARIQDKLISVTGLRRRENKRRTDLAVLKFDGPSALIELGFIANDRDRETLLNPQIRAAVCEAIADVVLTKSTASGGGGSKGAALAPSSAARSIFRGSVQVSVSIPGKLKGSKE